MARVRGPPNRHRDQLVIATIAGLCTPSRAVGGDADRRELFLGSNGAAPVCLSGLGSRRGEEVCPDAHGRRAAGQLRSAATEQQGHADRVTTVTSGNPFKEALPRGCWCEDE